MNWDLKEAEADLDDWFNIQKKPGMITELNIELINSEKEWNEFSEWLNSKGYKIKLIGNRGLPVIEIKKL